MRTLQFWHFVEQSNRQTLDYTKFSKYVEIFQINALKFFCEAELALFIFN
jgi:hypothetical protein